jgi:hypothetical protein
LTTLALATTTTSARCSPTRWMPFESDYLSAFRCCRAFLISAAALPSFPPAARHPLQVLRRSSTRPSIFIAFLAQIVCIKAHPSPSRVSCFAAPSCTRSALRLTHAAGAHSIRSQSACLRSRYQFMASARCCAAA